MVKEFSYRGATRQFSNRYHFHTGTPADSTHWTTLSDAIVLAEKAIYLTEANAGAKIVATFGYAGGSEIPVFSKTYTTDGTGSFAGGQSTPGDCAVLVRYATSKRSSKNHPVYLFNYYHGAIASATVSLKDYVVGPQVTAMQTYAAAWIAGFSDGTNTYVRGGPDGTTATGYLVEPLITHRDLPR